MMNNKRALINNPNKKDTRKRRKRAGVAISHHSSGATTVVTPPRPSSSASSTTTRPQSTTRSTATTIACYDNENNTQGDAESQVTSSHQHQVASSRHTQLDGEPPVAAVQVSSSSSSSSAAGVRNDVADIGAAALAAGVYDDDDDVTTVVQPAAAVAAATAVTAMIDTNNTFDSNNDASNPRPFGVSGNNDRHRKPTQNRTRCRIGPCTKFPQPGCQKMCLRCFRDTTGVTAPTRTKEEWTRCTWQIQYDELVEFCNKYGHTNVAQKYANNMKLGRWVSTQRILYKNGTLIQARINQLNELKFEWSRKNKKQETHERKQAEQEEAKRIFNLPVDKRTPEEIKFLADNPLRLIDMTPAKRLKSWRQLTPELTSELLVVIRKIRNENDAAFLSFETKDTTSRAVKYLLSAIHHGLVQYPDTCDPKVVQWNGVSKFCINSHIALLIALFMALRNDDDHQFSIEEWDEIHTEVMYGCQNAVDKEKQVGKRGCNSNPLVGSTIKKSGGLDDDGKVVWERTLSRPSNHNLAQIRNSSLQFTGGGTEKCSENIRKTVMGVSIVWPEFNNAITIQAIQDVGKSLMDHLSITNHSVVGKLLEMRHWHSMKYFGHRPVGIYWHHKDGGTLSSITTGEMEAVASTGAQWIQGTFKHK